MSWFLEDDEKKDEQSSSYQKVWIAFSKNYIGFTGIRIGYSNWEPLKKKEDIIRAIQTSSEVYLEDVHTMTRVGFMTDQVILLPRDRDKEPLTAISSLGTQMELKRLLTKMVENLGQYNINKFVRATIDAIHKTKKYILYKNGKLRK